jgi:hypothetical protein
MRLEELAAQFERARAAIVASPRWWHDHAGRFENDPAFDEIVRLGRQQRDQDGVKKRGRTRARS